MNDKIAAGVGPLPTIRAISHAERILIGDISQRVGERLSKWVGDQARNGIDPTVTARREQAEQIVRAELTALNKALVNDGKSRLDADRAESMRTEVIARLFGAGALQSLLDRTDWTNIYVSGTEARLELIGGERVYWGHIAEDATEVIDLVRSLASRSGRTARLFNPAQPLLSMRLEHGQRLSAAMDVVEAGIEIAIRRNALGDVTLESLTENGTLTTLAAEFLTAAVHTRRNIVVSGGTNSGKTTMYRALAAKFGSEERISTVEDAAELQLSDRHRHVFSYETRDANLDGVGAVTLQQLANHALRMSPDRVIIGEVKGDEITSYISAATQGNEGSGCTVHADSSEHAPLRMRMYLSRAWPYMTVTAITDYIAQAIDLIIHLRKDPKTGLRQVVSIREITGHHGETFTSNEVFTTNPIGTLSATGWLSDKSRRILHESGFDTERLQP
jgi:pilus assembly protein CpaF